MDGGEKMDNRRSLDRKWKEGLYSPTSTTKDKLINTEMNAVHVQLTDSNIPMNKVT